MNPRPAARRRQTSRPRKAASPRKAAAGPDGHGADAQAVRPAAGASGACASRARCRASRARPRDTCTSTSRTSTKIVLQALEEPAADARAALSAGGGPARGRPRGTIDVYPPRGRVQPDRRREARARRTGRSAGPPRGAQGQAARPRVVRPPRGRCRCLPRVASAWSPAATARPSRTCSRRAIAALARVPDRALAHAGTGAGRVAAHRAGAASGWTPCGVDVIVLCRGGGSIEDLWAFNELPVAEAIWRCSGVPVVSGVGHETDVTLADLVCDLRAHTPTDAAQTVIPGPSGVDGGARPARARTLDPGRGRPVRPSAWRTACVGRPPAESCATRAGSWARRAQQLAHLFERLQRPVRGPRGPLAGALERAPSAHRAAQSAGSPGRGERAVRLTDGKRRRLSACGKLVARARASVVSSSCPGGWTTCRR